jgi:GDPmannose 4,6-dehydratase
VIATGETHSVRELVAAAFSSVGLDWERHVRTDPSLVRPAEPQVLVGDARKARAELGWSPTVHFDELIRILLTHDLGEKGLHRSLDRVLA